MYGPGHLSFELTKRGSTPDKDRSYSFGFGPESMQEAIDEPEPEPRAGLPQYTALGLSVVTGFNPHLKIPLTGVSSAIPVGSSLMSFIQSHRGCFFSPDPGWKNQ
jgi:hypothetical protein